MTRTIIILLSSFIISSFNNRKINYSIEIYTLDNVHLKSNDGVPREFTVTRDQLPVLPLVIDDEINSFDTANFTLEYTPAAARIMGKLKPELSVGIPFVLTVDREPVLTGYICNILSSFGCASYVLFNSKSTSQVLQKGLPEHKYKTQIPERRKNQFLIQALERTGRLR